MFLLAFGNNSFMATFEVKTFVIFLFFTAHNILKGVTTNIENNSSNVIL